MCIYLNPADIDEVKEKKKSIPTKKGRINLKTLLWMILMQFNEDNIFILQMNVFFY